MAATQNGVIETASGDLLRAGRIDFSALPSFDEDTESYRTDVPIPAVVRKTGAAGQHDNWDGGAWIKVDQPANPLTKGDIMTYDGTDFVRCPAGSNEEVLKAASGTSLGLAYGPLVSAIGGADRIPRTTGVSPELNETWLPKATTVIEGLVELATHGESAADLAVQSNDPRMSDSRAPTAHAGTHASGGSDPLTSSHIIEAQIKRIRTTDGPTSLIVSGVADGEFLKRDGASIVGDTPGGGSGKPAWLGFSGANATVAKGATNYLGVFSGVVNSTEANAEYYCPSGGTLKNLRVYVSANASNNAGNTFTVRKNGAATGITVTYGSGETGLKADTVNTVAVAAGDRISLEQVNAASGGGSKDIVLESVSLELT